MTENQIHELNRRALQGAGAQGPEPALVRSDSRAQIRDGARGPRHGERALGHGPDRDRARPPRRRGPRSASACRGCSASPIFVCRPRLRRSSMRLAARILEASRRPAGRVVSRQRAPRRQAVSVHVAADRTRGRRPRSRRPGDGGWISSTRRSRSHRDVAGPGVLLFRQGARGRRAADRHRRAARLSALGRHRLAGRGVSDDAARLLRAAHSLSQLSDPVARVAGEGPRDCGAADAAPAAVAAGAGALRRASAAGLLAVRPSCASSSIAV